MNAQKIFEKALKKYEAAEKNISELTKTVQEVFSDYPTERALRNFDFMLQSVLLRQSLADGEMDKNEVAFIKGIVGTGDLLEDVKDKLSAGVESDLLSEYTWENIFLAPTELQAQVIDALNEYAAPAVEETALLCAVADAATKKNYYKAITKAVCSIITCFAKIDGKSTAEEIDEGCLSYIDMFAFVYLGAKESTEELFRNLVAIEKTVRKDWKLLQKEAKKAIDSLSPEDMLELVALRNSEIADGLFEVSVD